MEQHEFESFLSIEIGCVCSTVARTNQTRNQHTRTHARKHTRTCTRQRTDRSDAGSGAAARGGGDGSVVVRSNASARARGRTQHQTRSENGLWIFASMRATCHNARARVHTSSREERAVLVDVKRNGRQRRRQRGDGGRRRRGRRGDRRRQRGTGEERPELVEHERALGVGDARRLARRSEAHQRLRDVERRARAPHLLTTHGTRGPRAERSPSLRVAAAVAR